MRTLSINSNDDIYLDASGNLAIDTGKQALADIATNKTRTVYGEVPLDAQAGIPFFDVVFNKFDPSLFKQFLFATLKEVPEVTEVLQYSYEIKDGKLTYSAVLKTSEGEVTVNG